MNQAQKKRVIIAGGGTAGWIAAAAMAKQLAGTVDITLIESDQISTIGVGEATIPPMRTFHKLLGINEQDFMRATSSTFKLGISFENWGNIDQKYIHSFGVTGKSSYLAEFVHFWLHGKHQGHDAEYGDYCIELQAAKMGRFATSDKSKINFAYHLEASRYASFLREFSEARQVKRVEGKIVQVNQATNGSGFITGLQLDSGALIEGDLFIDCSGFRGLLIEQTLNTGYEDWSHWLPCDSALAVQTASVSPAPPYTRAIAHDSGWQWRIPLQHRVGNGIVYCSKYLSDDAARLRLLDNIEGQTLTEPLQIKFRTGKRRKHWNKNCIALGLASGFVEPLESTSIHLVMMGIIRLMKLFPYEGINPVLVEEYNRETSEELEKIRDFIILHYKVTQREDSAFWRYCKNMEVPDSLKHRIELFKRNAYTYQEPNELFRVDSWTQVMLGQGLIPDSYHHIVKTMSDNELNQFLNSMRTGMKSVAESLPMHQDFIERYCKASN
ncbi:MAG: tryptophan 7-halogenase [Paraglaciecola sp.]|nr:tryptophan 7-halogenase [Paraglaciecola sp.]